MYIDIDMYVFFLVLFFLAEVILWHQQPWACREPQQLVAHGWLVLAKVRVRRTACHHAPLLATPSLSSISVLELSTRVRSLAAFQAVGMAESHLTKCHGKRRGFSRNSVAFFSFLFFCFLLLFPVHFHFVCQNKRKAPRLLLKLKPAEFNPEFAMMFEIIVFARIFTVTI